MKVREWLRMFRRDQEDADVASIVGQTDGRKVPVATDEKKPARWGVRALVFGFVVFLAWAAFAPLSQGVPAHGFLKVEGNRKTIQHLKGGIIDEILVKEGDKVKADQPLVKLNETQLKAQLAIVESQLVVSMSMEARLNAERAHRDRVDYPQFLVERQALPQVTEAMLTQQQLFHARRAALKGEEAIARETIAGLEQQIRGLSAQEVAKAEQLKSYGEEMETLKPLYEQGFIPRNRLFELERAISYLSGQRSEDLASIGRARSQIAEAKLKILQSQEMFRKEVETQLAEAQSKVADLRERLIATQDDLTRVVLRAPNDGTVVDLAIHTIGGIVTPGQKLMDIVPEGGEVVIEVQIPTHLIDKVYAGLDADVHFTALDRTIVPTIPGKLVYLSADRMTDPKTDAPYYVGRVVVLPEGMKMLREIGENTLQLGMPADVVVKISDHSMIGYLLKPFLNRLRFAFTER